MTIFMLDQTHRATVLECGTNQRGEIARLAAIVRPEAALVLNADIEHTEGLGSLEGVADEEAALFATADRAVVSSAESMLLERVPGGTPCLTFGLDAAVDVRLAARAISGAGQQVIELILRRELVENEHAQRLRVILNLLGASSALNAAGAVAAALGAINRPLRGDELQAIGAAIGVVTPVAGRLMIRNCGGITIIDDTYNSNPRSLRAALAAARETADGIGARLIVAIGDMLELGELSDEMHVAAIRDIFTARPAACVLVGREMRRAAIESGTLPTVVLTDDSREAALAVAPIVRAGDVLLVKGSRSIAMERILDALPEPVPG
jgi:UDP-N-acetylmuramoyl-tripeptide--D-alanyl-D-alanine ligase